jgi:hypothetical protein
VSPAGVTWIGIACSWDEYRQGVMLLSQGPALHACPCRRSRNGTGIRCRGFRRNHSFSVWDAELWRLMLMVPTPGILVFPGQDAGWSVQVLARQSEESEYLPTHHPTTDACAVQHPGTRTLQSREFVTVHLIGLCSLLERGDTPSEAAQLMRRAVERFKGDFSRPEPPLR